MEKNKQVNGESDRKRPPCVEDDINEMEIKRRRVAEFVNESDRKEIALYEIERKLLGTRNVDEIDCATVTKKIIYQPRIVLAPESEHSFSGSESELSIQGKETDEARDTPDTSHSSDSVLTEVEYEVASLSEDSRNALGEPMDSSSASSSQDRMSLYRKCLAAGGAITKSILEDDLGLWADSSSSEESDKDEYGSSDSDFPKWEYWHCIQCKDDNYNPGFPFCEKCYRLRKEYFPRRPLPKKKLLKTLTNEKRQSKASRETSPKSTESVDEGVSSQIQSSSSSSQELAPSDSQEIPPKSDEATLCSICYVKPVNAVFIHRRGVHAVACMQCAKKLWKSGKPCPICNKKIERASRVYFDGDKLVMHS